MAACLFLSFANRMPRRLSSSTENDVDWETPERAPSENKTKPKSTPPKNRQHLVFILITYRCLKRRPPLVEPGFSGQVRRNVCPVRAVISPSHLLRIHRKWTRKRC